MSLRVRFAPSPTGFLHVGGARTALYNWLIARREGGVFVLRIEDTDRERSSDEVTSAILDGMRWLGLEWDEGPYFQGEGVERHRAEALRLLDEGKAYRDFTDPAELARLRGSAPDEVIRYPRDQAAKLGREEAESRADSGEPHAIRFRVPPGDTAWDDAVHGKTRFPNEALEDLVILRSDGSPTYNLAVVSDDAHMAIDLVLRGDDHISNTPKQILLHRALGNPEPRFAHVPMILGQDGKRLSKRHGATAVGEYEGLGILPEAMINFLALLGWSPGTDEEVFDRTELIARFSLDRVLKKSSVFDPQKLEWLNGQHISRLPAERLLPLVLGHLESLRPQAERRAADDPSRMAALVTLLATRARTVGELARRTRPFLAHEIEYEPGAVKKHWMKDPEATMARLDALRTRLGAVTWEETALEEALRALAAERGEGAGKLIHPLRVALVGEAVSPGIFEVLVVMGKDLALERMEVASRRIRAENVVPEQGGELDRKAEETNDLDLRGR